MIAEISRLLLAFTAGMFIGAFFFGVLWITVRHLPMARRPAVLVVGSLFLRTGVALLLFYLVMSGEWERLLACMLGFLAMRKIMTWRFQPEQSESSTT
jgi:F1F0 ATPase subunit 2